MKHNLVPILLAKKTPWYLTGGVSASNILGVWQPIKAPNYATSKISLVNPSASNLLVDGAAYPTWQVGVGWRFSSASSQYLTIASAIATAVPLSFVCRFVATAVTASYGLISICDTAANNAILLTASGDVASDPVRASSDQANTTVSAVTTTGFTGSPAIYTATGVWASTTSRVAYINGGSSNEETTDSTPAGLDTTYVGVWGNKGTLTAFMNGSISACAIYNVALSAVQVLAIHNAMVAQGL